MAVAHMMAIIEHAYLTGCIRVSTRVRVMVCVGLGLGCVLGCLGSVRVS